MFTVTRKVGQQVTFVQNINSLPLIINPSSSVVTDQIITDEYQLIKKTNDTVIMSSSLLVGSSESYRLFCFPFNALDDTETVNYLINQFSLTIEDKEYILINELVVEPENTLDPEIGNILLNKLSVSGLNDYWAQYCEDTGCLLHIINIENIYCTKRFKIKKLEVDVITNKLSEVIDLSKVEHLEINSYSWSDNRDLYNHTLFKQLTSLKSLKLDEDLFTSDWMTFAEMTQLEEIIIHSDEDNADNFIEELRLFREVNKCKVHYIGYKMFDIDEIDLSSCYSKLKEYSTVNCTQDGIVNVNCNHGAVTLIIKHKPNKSVKYE